MAANIEFKARLQDPDLQTAAAERITGEAPEILLQRDTFFNVANGRLKLREISGSEAHLIQYFRDDDPAVRRSDYIIAPVPDPTMMVEAMDRSLGIRGIVRKVRRLWLIGQTRIHFDSVDGLGEFVELEVVLEPGQSDEAGLETARNLMGQLHIRDEDILAEAYIDMLESTKVDTPIPKLEKNESSQS